MFDDTKIKLEKPELVQIESSEDIKTENEDEQEEQGIMEQSIPRFSYTLDLSFNHNPIQETSCQVENAIHAVKPSLEYVKLKTDNSIVTNSNNPWDLARKTFPRSLERILSNVGVKSPKRTINKNLSTGIRNKSNLLIEDKNVHLQKNKKITECMDKFMYKTAYQVGTDFTTETKTNEEKTTAMLMGIANIEYEDNHFTQDCVKENISESDMEKKRKLEQLEDNISEGKYESVYLTSENNEVRDCKKKKRHHQYEESMLFSNSSELVNLPENISKKKKKKKEKHKGLTYIDSNKLVNLHERCSGNNDKFLSFTVENENLTGKKGTKKNGETDENMDIDQFVDLNEEDDSLTEKSKNNKKQKQFGDSISCTDNNELVDLAEGIESLTSLIENIDTHLPEENESPKKKSKKKKTGDKKLKQLDEDLSYIDSNKFIHLTEDNESIEEESIMKIKHKHCEDSELLKLVEKNDSLKSKSKKKNSKQLEENKASVENNELVLPTEENEGRTEKSKKRKKHKQPEENNNDNSELDFLTEGNENVIDKSKKNKHKQLQENTPCIDTDQFVNLREENEGIKEKTKNKKKYEQPESHLDNNELVHLSDEIEKITSLVSYIDSHDFGHLTEKMKTENSLPYIDNAELAQLAKENGNFTRKTKKKTNKQFEENLSDLNSNSFIEVNDSVTEETKKKIKQKQSDNSKSSINNTEEDENLSRKSKKNRHKLLEKNISHIDSKDFINLTEEKNSFANENKNKKKAEETVHSTTCCDDNELVNLTEENILLKSKKNKHKRIEDYSIVKDKFVCLAEDNETPNNKQKKHKQTEDTYIDNDELAYLTEMKRKPTKKGNRKKQKEIEKKVVDINKSVHLDNETFPERSKKKKKVKQSEDSKSCVDSNELVEDKNSSKKSNNKKNKFKKNEILTEKNKNKKKPIQVEDSIFHSDKNNFFNLNRQHLKEDESVNKPKIEKKHRQLDECVSDIHKYGLLASVGNINEENQIDQNDLFHLDKENVQVPQSLLQQENLVENETPTRKKRKKKELMQHDGNINKNESAALADAEIFVKDLNSNCNASNHINGDMEVNKAEGNELPQYIINSTKTRRRSKECGNTSEENIESITMKTKFNENPDERKTQEIDNNLQEENEIELCSVKSFSSDISKNTSINSENRENVDISNNVSIHELGSPKDNSVSYYLNTYHRESTINSSLEDNMTTYDKKQKENISEINISEKSNKVRKKKTYGDSPRKKTFLTVEKHRMSEDEDIFTGIFKRESSSSLERLNKFSPVKFSNSEKESESSFEMKEPSKNLEEAYDANKKSGYPASESFSFADILSQSKIDKIKERFNDIVNKSNVEKSSSEDESVKYKPKNQLKQGPLHDDLKLNNNLEDKQKKDKVIDLLKESRSIQEIKEELEMPDIWEERQKVQDLVIEIDWPIPPIHRIAYFVNSFPTREQRASLKAAGITFKLGKYTKDEDEKILQNWASFCKNHDWKEEDYQPFLKCSINSSFGILTKYQRQKFAQYLTHGFENRLMYSIYHRFQRLFSKNEIDTGRFTEEDDKILLEYVNSENSRQPFADLVEIMKRSRLALIKRYKHIVNKNENKKVIWDRALTESLLANLIEVTCSVNLSELKNHDITIQEWKKVSKNMNIPVRKLQRAWLFTLSPRFFSENYSTDISEVKNKLVDLLYTNYHDWRDINWREVAKTFDNRFSAAKLCKVAHDLLNKKVPPKRRSDLHKSLKYVRNNYEDVGETVDRVTFVKEILADTENGTIIPSIPKIVNKSLCDEKSHKGLKLKVN